MIESSRGSKSVFRFLWIPVLLVVLGTVLTIGIQRKNKGEEPVSGESVAEKTVPAPVDITGADDPETPEPEKTDEPAAVLKRKDVGEETLEIESDDESIEIDSSGINDSESEIETIRKGEETAAPELAEGRDNKGSEPAGEDETQQQAVILTAKNEPVLESESDEDPDLDIDPEQMREFIAGLARGWTPSDLPSPRKPPIKEEPELAVAVPEQRREPVVPDEPEPPAAPPPPPEKPAEAKNSGDLILDSPWDGSYYSSLVEVRGMAPAFSSLEWKSEAMDSGGTIPIEEDGTFTFNVSTHKHTDILDILVTGINSAGEMRELSLELINDGVGPSIALESPTHGGYYIDDVEVVGNVGPGPFDPEGIGEIESLLWTLEEEEPRPIFFNAEGGFSFKVGMGDRTGRVNLHLISFDLNGNESRKTVSLLDGTLAPELLVEGLEDNDEYGAGIRLAGRVLDPYGGQGELGGIDSLEYEILASDAVTRDGIVSGSLYPDADGIFDFSVMTGDLRGDQEVTLIVTGKNGRQTLYNLRLRQGRSAIPDFNIQSSDSSVLARWNPVPTARAYELTVLDSRGISVRHDADEGPFVVRGLENGYEYRFRVEALLASGEVRSHEVSSIPLSKDTLKPSVSGEFRRIRVKWNPVPGSERYSVMRADSPEGPFVAVEESIEGNEFLDTEVAFGSRYWYSIAPAAYPELQSDSEDGESLSSQGENVEQVGRLDEFQPDSIYIEGDYAMVASIDAGLVLVDITEPARPRTVGRLDINQARDVVVSGSYAYIASGTGGLKVVNIDDPQRPLQVGSKLAGDAVALTMADEYVFLADRERGLRVLDVSDSSSPARLAATEGLEGLDVVLDGSRAYLAAGKDGLIQYDVSVPARPREKVRIPFNGAETVLIRGSHLIVGGSVSGLAVCDISDPDSPRIVSTLENIDVLQLESSEDFLLVTTPTELVLVDLRNPSKPGIFQTYPSGGSAAMAVQGDNLLIASPDGMELYQTYLVGSSFVVDEVATEGRSYGISRSGDELYIASHAGGVAVFNRNLSLLRTLPGDFSEASAFGPGGLVLIADGPSGLRVSHDDGSGGMLFESIGRAVDVTVSGDIAYVATDRGVFILSLSDSIPRALGTLNFGSCRFVHIAGGTLYAGGDDELRLYALLDGELPALIGELNIPGIRSVHVHEGIAAVLGEDGVDLFDISRKEKPRVLGRIPLEHGESVSLDERYVYISAGYAGLMVFDIRKPASPKLVSSCNEVFAMETVMDGDAAYVVDGKGLKKISLFIPQWLR